MKKTPEKTDLRLLCDFAVMNGAGGAEAIDARSKAVDERVQLELFFERVDDVVLRGECFG